MRETYGSILLPHTRSHTSKTPPGPGPFVFTSEVVRDTLPITLGFRVSFGCLRFLRTQSSQNDSPKGLHAIIPMTQHM